MIPAGNATVPIPKIILIEPKNFPKFVNIVLKVRTSFELTDLFLEIKKIEINCFLSGENDNYDIYLEIHAGAGGTESQDWAQMLQRMYMRWSERKKFKFKYSSS